VLQSEGESTSLLAPGGPRVWPGGKQLYKKILSIHFTYLVKFHKLLPATWLAVRSGGARALQLEFRYRIVNYIGGCGGMPKQLMPPW